MEEPQEPQELQELQEQQQRALTQTGILLLPNGTVPPRIELPVPRLPPPPALPNPQDYGHLLPALPAGSLHAWVAPATEKLGLPIVIIAVPEYRMPQEASAKRGCHTLNGQAVYLTANLQTGFGEQVG